MSRLPRSALQRHILLCLVDLMVNTCEDGWHSDSDHYGPSNGTPVYRILSLTEEGWLAARAIDPARTDRWPGSLPEVVS